VTANFARRLEIERDEAREELHDLRLNLGADAEGYTLLHAVCVLQQERDEARAAFVIATDQMVIAQCKLREANKERDEAREERDKIQTELEMWRDGNIMHQIHRDELEKTERERDEAREAFKEMWRSGDAFLPHVDSETINRWRKAAGWEETK
jgi:quinol monooxygenase YgiN